MGKLFGMLVGLVGRGIGGAPVRSIDSLEERRLRSALIVKSARDGVVGRPCIVA